MVRADPETIWPLLTEPQSYERWAGVELVAAEPAGPAADGQRMDFRTREFGRWWRVRFDVGKVDPLKSLELKVRLPFGVVNHEVVVLTPVDKLATLVTFN